MVLAAEPVGSPETIFQVTPPLFTHVPSSGPIQTKTILIRNAHPTVPLAFKFRCQDWSVQDHDGCQAVKFSQEKIDIPPNTELGANYTLDFAIATGNSQHDERLSIFVSPATDDHWSEARISVYVQKENPVSTASGQIARDRNSAESAAALEITLGSYGSSWWDRLPFLITQKEYVATVTNLSDQTQTEHGELVFASGSTIIDRSPILVEEFPGGETNQRILKVTADDLGTPFFPRFMTAQLKSETNTSNQLEFLVVSPRFLSFVLLGIAILLALSMHIIRPGVHSHRLRLKFASLLTLIGLSTLVQNIIVADQSKHTETLSVKVSVAAYLMQGVYPTNEGNSYLLISSNQPAGFYVRNKDNQIIFAHNGVGFDIKLDLDQQSKPYSIEVRRTLP